MKEAAGKAWLGFEIKLWMHFLKFQFQSWKMLDLSEILILHKS